ncbi:DNA polymerase IV [Phycicoccus sp. CSK15P-2]|uniref:DNA polymerase IV n=1 Tax=Phycicoccus sp. CSK15P-2 TaxID=2807627 RepID=UPI00194E252C|nr:DNA polymerase IV [Phycicoccus sp. CSK15P-2]MBM6404331.1 DNA polymerase IV [Phycicoccus sp. CSK15P-2]
MARAFPFVLHVDLDQFIAAVEVLRHPELAGREVVVGGRGDTTERAVVSTASYEARERGVRSGMPLRVAARKAPDALFLPVDGPHYLAASEQVVAAVGGLGLVVEVLGWDEMFVGGETDDPEDLARRIQATVLEATRLHCSVGVGDTRVRAKIATDLGKPRGVFRLTAENWRQVMGHRPTTALWGVGSRVAARLERWGVRTVDELAAADPEVLVGEFGPRMGPWYGSLGRGEGSAEVDDAPWVARSHSRETTYQENLTSATAVAEAVRVLTDQVLADVAREGRPVERVGVKIRYAPFVTVNRSRKLPASTCEAARVHDAVQALLADHLEEGREVRLLGVRAEMTMPEDGGDDVERAPVRGRV